MKNDRGRRSGKAGAKGGRTEGRGRGSSHPQGSGAGVRGHNKNASEGDGGGRSGGTGGARGGKGQSRNGGRGGGSKRAAASTEAGARVGGNTTASSGAKVPKKSGFRPSKKAKTVEPAKNVLWNAKGKATSHEGGGSPSPLDGGVVGNASLGNGNGDTQDLSTLAKRFKERFGEEMVSDDELGDATQGSAGVFETPGRKRRFSSGARAKTPVEEMAQSMSPAKLAAEVQKARARAREERFGGAGSSATKLPPSSRPTRSPNRGTPPPDRGSRIPLDTSTTKQQQQQGSRKKKKVTGSAATPASSPAQEAASASAVAAATPTFGAIHTPSPKTPPSPQTVGKEIVSLRTRTAAVSSLAATTRRTSLLNPAAGRPTSDSTCSFSGPSVPVGSTAEKVPTSAPSKTGRRPAVASKTVDDENSPVEQSQPSAASAAMPKRFAPTAGDVVVKEPPPKKILTPSKMSSSPPSPRQVGVAGGKIHTLRLRLRADVVAEPKRPASGGDAAGGEDGGSVKDVKTFEPPTPRLDAGVEECKGFDPPNLTPTTKSPQQSTVANPAPPTASTKLAQAPTGASVVSPRTVSRSSIVAGGGTPSTPACGLGRFGSWGPSFGIVGATGGRAIGSPMIPATPAPSPNVTPSSKTSNPWILSAETPTFAKNQGRPLAQSFLQSKTSRRGKTNGDISTGEKKQGSAECAGDGRDSTGALVSVSSVRASGVRGNDGGGGGDLQRGIANSVGGRALAKVSSPNGSSTRRSLSPPPAATLRDRGADEGDVVGNVLQPQARLPSGTANAESDVEPPPVARQGAASFDAVRGAVGVEAALASGREVTGVEGAANAPMAGQAILGVQINARAGQLLDRLKSEREKSLDFERRLTKALLDL